MQVLTGRLFITTVMTVLLMAGQAHAIGLAAAGPVNSTTPGAPFPANGMPKYYQDSNGLALQGCLDNTPLGGLSPMCVLPIIQEEDYDFHFPIAYNGGLSGDLVAFPNGPAPGPTSGLNGGACNAVLGGVLQPGCVNYPSETFYYYVSSNPKATFPIGTGSVSLILIAVEGASAAKDSRLLQQSPPLPANAKSIGGPRPVQGQQAVFQRFKVIMDNTPVAGNYTFVHPWGSLVFNCPTAGATCKVIQDIPAGTPLNFLTAPDPALGQQTPGSIGPFMVSANPLPPATPAPFITNPAGNVFIGNPNAVGTKGVIPGGLAACPTCNIDGNGFSFMRVDGPAGLSTGDITEFFIGGQVLGLQVSPATNDLGLVKVGATGPGKTFTITNLTGAPASISLASSDPQFVIPAATDHCSTNTSLVPPAPLLPATPGGNSCTFEVAMAPTADGAASATITVNAVGAPPATVTVSGTGDGVPPVLTLAPLNKITNNNRPQLSGSASDSAGAVTVKVSINGGAAQNATLSAGAWTFTPALALAEGPNPITVTASDSALPAPGNQTILSDSIIVDTIAPAVAIDPPASSTVSVGTLKVTGTASDANGISSVGVSMNGALQGLATVTGGTWSFTVAGLVPNALSSISAAASDPAGNQKVSAPVSVTFVVPRDGDINMDGVVDIADALMALRTAVNLINPSLEQRAHGDVSPASNATPPQAVGDGKNDVADALLILRKTLNLPSF